MRSRRHQERLEKYYKVVNDTILKHQVSKFLLVVWKLAVRRLPGALRFQWINYRTCTPASSRRLRPPPTRGFATMSIVFRPFGRWPRLTKQRAISPKI